MTIADTSRVQLRYVKETVAGTTPSTPTMLDWRLTGTTLNENRESIASQEIRSDRQTTDLISVSSTVAGDVNIEASWKEHQPFEVAALEGDLSTALAFTADTVSAAASDDSINDSGSGFPVVVPGQWVRVSGFATAANNGVFRVASRTASKIVFDRKLGSASLALTDEAAGEDVSLKGQFAKNGVTRHSFTIEKEYSDISKFFLFRGCEVSAWQGSLTVGEIFTQTFSFIGRSSTQSGTTAASANTPSQTESVLNAVDNVGDIAFGDVIYTDGVQSISWQLDNNMREQRQIGQYDLAGIGSGTMNLTGSMTAYFSNNSTLYTQFISNAYSGFDFYTQDYAGNVVVYSMPRIKFSSANVTAGAINQDVLLELEYQAVRDPDLGWTMGISYIPA
jgi:hypothetical protein